MRADGAGQGGDVRRARLAASLRENLKRRKAQQRSREAGPVEAGSAESEPADCGVTQEVGRPNDERRET